MNKKYSLYYLSQEFYKKYDKISYPEIENKETRPYMVLLIKIESNTFAIPFRTNININIVTNLNILHEELKVQLA